MRNLLGVDGSADRRLIAVLLDEELRSAVDGQAAGYSRARIGRSKLRAMGLEFPIVVARLECLSRDTVVIGDLIADLCGAMSALALISSALIPRADFRAATSTFQPVPSASPPGADVISAGAYRSVLTHNGHW